jgi:cytochrome c
MKTLTRPLAAALFLFGLAYNVAAAETKGTPEQAVALVKKAAAYIKANGKEKAFAAFDDPKGEFVDRDLYIFVYSQAGQILSHGANKRMIGKNLMDIKDEDGKKFVKEQIDLANAKGSGWVDLKWVNPVTKAIQPKASYVERVDDIIVGSGIYK